MSNRQQKLDEIYSLLDNFQEKGISLTEKQTYLSNQLKKDKFGDLYSFVFSDLKIEQSIFEDFVSFLEEHVQKQSSFSLDFHQSLYDDVFLPLNSREAKSYYLYFQKNLLNSKNILIKFFQYYFTFNKPFFVSGMSTKEISLVYKKTTLSFIKQFSKIFDEKMQEYHYAFTENGIAYFRNDKRFNFSFAELSEILNESTDIVLKDFSAKFTEKQHLLSSHLLSSIFSNEDFIYDAFMFFVNAGDNDSTFDNLTSLISFDFQSVQELFLNYFSQENNDVLFNEIQSKIDFMEQEYGFTYVFTPYVSSNSNKQNTFTPINQILSLDTTIAHWKFVSDFYNLSKNKNLNKGLVIKTPDFYSYNKVEVDASFTHIHHHKFITQDFLSFDENQSIILIHEYQHYLDYLHMQKLPFLGKSKDFVFKKSKFNYVTTTFPLLMHNIFCPFNDKIFNDTIVNSVSNSDLKDSYFKLFENYIFSLTSKFYFEKNDVDNAHIKNRNIQLIENEITNVVPTMIKKSFLEQLNKSLNLYSSTENRYKVLIKIIDLLNNDEYNSIFHKRAEIDLSRSILPFYLSKYTFNQLTKDFNFFKNNFFEETLRINKESHYSQWNSILNFNNPQSYLQVKNYLFCDILNIIYGIQNTILDLYPEAKKIFIFGKTNCYESILHFRRYNDPTNILTQDIFNDLLSKIINSDIKNNIHAIVDKYDVIPEYVLVATDSSLNKSYVAVPNIFNQAVNNCSNYDINSNNYLNMGAEIIARSTSSIYLLQDKFKSTSLLKSAFKKITSFIGNEDPVLESQYHNWSQSISINDFTRDSYIRFLNNIHYVTNTLQCLSENQYNVFIEPIIEDKFKELLSMHKVGNKPVLTYKLSSKEIMEITHIDS